MNRAFRTLAITAAGLLAAPALSDAAVVYTLVSDQPTYQVQIGQTATVELYLLEQTGDGAPSTLLDEDGLFTAHYRVSQPPDMSPVQVAAIVSASPNTADFAWSLPEDVKLDPGGLMVDVSLVADFELPAGPMGDDLGNGLRSVYLGSVDMRGDAPGQRVFTIADIPDLDGFVTFSGDLDVSLDANVASTQFTFVVVPEPAGLLGLIVLSGLSLRRRM